MVRALIIGGGVGGPVAAMALQRAGWDATVHEAYPSATKDHGAWLGVQVNGLDALRAIGADHVVADAGFPTPRVSFVNGAGKRLGSVGTGTPLPGARGGVSLTRADLYRSVHEEALRRGIDIRYASSLTGARTTPRGVEVTFADGSSDVADLVVGADGVRSTVRRLLDPTSPPPRYVPVLNLGGYSEHRLPGGEVGHLTMVFGRHAFFGLLPAPDGRTWWFSNPRLPTEPAGDEVSAKTDEAWRAELKQLHAVDTSFPAAEIIDGTVGELRAWTTYDVPSVRVWHDDRIVLMGDAAHATSPAAGQGSSMAIEDAVVLARCVRDMPLPAALARYEELRRARVEKVVASGARMSSAKSPGTVARTMRDLVMPVMMKQIAKRGGGPLSWAQQHHVDWDAPAPAPTP